MKLVQISTEVAYYVKGCDKENIDTLTPQFQLLHGIF